MDFENMTHWEFAALANLVEDLAEKLDAFSDALERGKGEQAALDEYERAHNEFERALTTISVRQRFTVRGEARLRDNGQAVAASAGRVASEAPATRKGVAL